MFAVNLTVVIMVSTSWNKFSQSIDHSHDGFHLQCTYIHTIPEEYLLGGRSISTFRNIILF